LDSGNLNGSRWGLKGSEDLGGGLSAIFALEAGFATDTGAQASATSFFNRQSLVGLSGSFGTVKLGRIKNPVYDNSDIFDPFGDSLAGDSARLINYQGSRTDNTISYEYAANGFKGNVQYGLGEVAGNSSASRTVAGFLSYKQGPVGVVLTTESQSNATDTHSTKVTLLGGNYNFGIAKAFLTVASEQGDGTAVGRDQRDVLIGATAPIGAGTLMLSYLKKTDNLVSDKNAHQVAVGYTYDLSKRTALYTSYGQLSNDSKASYKVATAGNSDKLFNVGVRHFF
jgi:predicted porin